jgi:hypothetical protein
MTERSEPGDRKLEPRGPLSAREILKGFRDLGTDEHRETRLACDPSFNRYTAFWVLGETLDAAYAALEGMSLVSPERARSLTDEARPAILRFLAQHYDPDAGRFSTDSSPRTRGIFAFHTAIGTLRSLHQIRADRRLPHKAFEESAHAIGTTSEAVRQGLDELIAVSREGDGVVENPARPLIPSLTALYTASSALWYLQCHERSKGGRTNIYRFIDSWRLERFVDGCIKRQRIGDRVIAGFSIHPDHQELCVNTTSFGLRLRQRLGMALDADLAREIECFLRLSHRDGGFSSTLWEPRSLNATYLGLRALQMLLPENRWKGFLKQEGEAIRRFVESCSNPTTGGAPFAPDLDRYRENCLATRYRIQTLRLLDCPLPKGSVTSTFEFFHGLYNRDTGGFHAYPAGQIVRNDFDLQALERYLDDKDEILHRHHQEKLADPSHVPSYSPDSRTLKLYDRLAELEASRADEEEIEAVWQALRQVQEAEAARFEAYFDARVLKPLEEGHAELDRLERLFADR